MPLDLNQSNVSLDNPVFSTMLDNLQANILKGHGRNFAYHLFFKFDTAKANEAIDWIRQFATTTITSARKQLEETAQFNKGLMLDGGTIFALSLSSSGYNNLGIAASKPDSDEAFILGMKHPDTIAAIKDDTNNWEKEFKEATTIDMLIIVADSDAKVVQANAQAIIKQTMPFASLVKSQRGNVLKMKETSVGIEHFGYADGISQPMYLAEEINNQTQPRTWDDETNLDMLLVAEPNGDDCFGSYFVFRKLEQNVVCFKTAEGDNGDRPGAILEGVLDDKGDANDELSGAMIVGRFENSMPVTKSSRDKINPKNPNPDDKHVDNDFDYSNDKDALKCPFHAHIRLVNPRNGDPEAIPADIRSHRITRRGIPFDDNEIKRIPDDKITEITDDMLSYNQPTGKVGLLFMCYQSSIRTHFEVLQGNWANTGIIAPATKSIGQDSLITQSIQDDNSKRTIPKQWSQSAQSRLFNFSGFVKMRGGEYFYTPSLHFLQTLTSAQELITINETTQHE